MIKYDEDGRWLWSRNHDIQIRHIGTGKQMFFLPKKSFDDDLRDRIFRTMSECIYTNPHNNFCNSGKMSRSNSVVGEEAVALFYTSLSDKNRLLSLMIKCWEQTVKFLESQGFVIAEFESTNGPNWKCPYFSWKTDQDTLAGIYSDKCSN